MRALQLVGTRRLELAEVSIPEEVGPGDVLIRVAAVGICGTDLHYYRGEPAGYETLPLPFIMGHEFAGVVEATGRDVSDLKVGDRVAVDPAIACGTCELCMAGHAHVCPRGRFVGAPGLPGALRERLVHPARLAVKLARSVSFAQAAALEPLGVALHALDLGGLRVADRVAVLGCGPIGLFLIQLARLAGARDVFATDVHDYRLAAARRCGAREAINAARRDAVAAVMEATDGRGVDVAFEVAGAPDTPDQAAAMTRPLGTVVIVGICADDRMSFRAALSRRRGLTIKVSRRMKHVYERTVALVERGMVDVDGVISHTVPLEQGADAVSRLVDYEDGSLKLIITVA